LTKFDEKTRNSGGSKGGLSPPSLQGKGDRSLRRSCIGLTALALSLTDVKMTLMATSSRKITRLSDLVPGQQPADFFALLIEKSPRVTSNGKPYFSCRFRDARRAAIVRVWGDPDNALYEQCMTEWQVGHFYKIRGVYNPHPQYGPQLDLVQIRPVKPEDHAAGFNELDFVEHSRHEPSAMLDQLHTLAVKHIQDEALRKLVRGLLTENADALMRLPAQRERSFPFVGGLLEHTLSVTQTAIDLGERYATFYPDLKPPLNRDVITAGAILHDIGRVAEMADDLLTPTYTVPGRLVGYQVLGRDMVRAAAGAIPELNPELLALLEHILLTSLHPSESARAALVPEAMIVHYADDLDLKMERFVRLLGHDSAEGPFTDRDPVLGHRVFKGRSV
jgi:3'-5' exoribonuclease